MGHSHKAPMVKELRHLFRKFALYIVIVLFFLFENLKTIYEDIYRIVSASYLVLYEYDPRWNISRHTIVKVLF